MVLVWTGVHVIENQLIAKQLINDLDPISQNAD